MVRVLLCKFLRILTYRFRFMNEKQLSDLSHGERFTFLALGLDKERWLK